jgi:hypothetical protein
MPLLLTFQEIIPISKTRNQLRDSGTGGRFLTAIQAKNNINVSVWTKRSHMASIEALTCLTREGINQQVYKSYCFLCL